MFITEIFIALVFGIFILRKFKEAGQ
jgi:hypothetical protein